MGNRVVRRRGDWHGGGLGGGRVPLPLGGMLGFEGVTPSIVPQGSGSEGMHLYREDVHAET